MAPQAEWGPDFDRGYDRLLEKVFEGCRANAACRATYPHVRRRFYRQIARLSPEDVAVVNEALEVFPGRIERDDWMSSARELHREVYGSDPVG